MGGYSHVFILATNFGFNLIHVESICFFRISLHAIVKQSYALLDYFMKQMHCTAKDFMSYEVK